MLPSGETPWLMSGEQLFHPFVYLLVAADTALDAASNVKSGQGYHCVTTIIHSAFAFEAAVNHVGDLMDTLWAKNERTYGNWKDKANLIEQKYGFKIEWGTTPAQSVAQSFYVRDRLAHGKTWIGKQSYIDRGDGIADKPHPFPDWITKFNNTKKAGQVLGDTRALIAILLESAGHKKIDLHRFGMGRFGGSPLVAKQKLPKDEWKLKGT